MSTLYDRELQKLRREIEMEGARPSVIDERVQALLRGGCSTLAADLLALLSDEAEYDEGMFSIIHAAETDADRPYVASLLSVFPILSASSPRWASIVMMRVMNSEGSWHELVRQLRDAPVLVKDSLRSICERINEVNPEFLNRTAPVLVAAM